MKAYTNIEQSKKLAEILPLESADMFWIHVEREGFNDWWKVETIQRSFIRRSMNIPCWSLAALLSLMPKIEHMKPFIDLTPNLDSEEVAIYYHSEDSPYIVKDNLVDACYEMILKLNEQKLL